MSLKTAERQRLAGQGLSEASPRDRIFRPPILCDDRIGRGDQMRGRLGLWVRSCLIHSRQLPRRQRPLASDTKSRTTSPALGTQPVSALKRNRSAVASTVPALVDKGRYGPDPR